MDIYCRPETRYSPSPLQSWIWCQLWKSLAAWSGKWHLAIYCKRYSLRVNIFGTAASTTYSATTTSLGSTSGIDTEVPVELASPARFARSLAFFWCCFDVSSARLHCSVLFFGNFV